MRYYRVKTDGKNYIINSDIEYINGYDLRIKSYTDKNDNFDFNNFTILNNKTYKVIVRNKSYDNIYTSNVNRVSTQLVPYELFTYKELIYKGFAQTEKMDLFEEVEISKNNIYWFFGCRFEIDNNLPYFKEYKVLEVLPQTFKNIDLQNDEIDMFRGYLKAKKYAYEVSQINENTAHFEILVDTYQENCINNFLRWL